MKLPNAKSAYIPREKLLDYLLSETHPVGKSKAKFFRSLGFDENNVASLERSILSLARKCEVGSSRETPYGVDYVVKGSIVTPKNKKVVIKTVWFVGIDQARPRFVTAMPVI